MNVVFISNQPHPIGMAGSRRIRLFAEYLAKQLVTVNLFVVGKSNNSNDSSGILNNVKYQFVKFRYSQILFGNKYLNQQLVALFDKQKSNFVYIYGGLNIETVKSLSFAINLGYKIIVDLVEDYSKINEKISKRLALRFKINSFINKKMKSYVNGYVVISKYLKEKIKSYDTDNNIQLIPISAGNLYHKPNKVEKRQYFRFLYTGTYGVKDGIEYMLAAYNKLYEKYPNIELFLTGKKGRLLKNYTYLDEINSNSNIKFLGTIPESEFYNFLADSDVLLMTRIASQYANSGFPFKLGEYLATGKPVIATDVSDIKLYLKDKESIILAQPSDSESLFKAMEYTYLNYQKCIKIGRNGKKAALQYFNPETNGEILYNFLNRI